MKIFQPRPTILIMGQLHPGANTKRFNGFFPQRRPMILFSPPNIP